MIAWLLSRIVIELAVTCSIRKFLFSQLAEPLLGTIRPCEKCGTLLELGSITCGGCGRAIWSGVFMGIGALLAIFGLVYADVKRQELVNQILSHWPWREGAS